LITQRIATRSQVVVQRPTAVTAIALYQFFKAWFLLVVTAVVLLAPDMEWGATFREMVFVASHGGSRIGLFTPVIGIYAAVVGAGLWGLKKWARRVLIVSSGLTVARWIRYLSINWAVRGTLMSGRSLTPGYEQQSVFALLFVDALIFLYLALYDGVAEAFGQIA